MFCSFPYQWSDELGAWQFGAMYPGINLPLLSDSGSGNRLNCRVKTCIGCTVHQKHLDYSPVVPILQFSKSRVVIYSIPISISLQRTYEGKKGSDCFKIEEHIGLKFKQMQLKNSKKLFLIRLFHTFIIAGMTTFIFYVFYAGISGTKGIFLTVSIIAVGLEGIVLLLNKVQCPLTKLAVKYGDNHKRFFDSFLPKKITPFVVPGLTLIFVIGLVLVLI